MKICVTQREGIRHFTRFTDLAERDKLTVELCIEDKNGKTVSIDLTSALIEEYSKHPEVGRVSSEPIREILGLKPIKPLVTKEAKTVSPAYLTESRKQKDEVLAKVKEAQQKAAEERKQKKLEQDAARARQLAAARKVKAEKESVQTTKPIASTKAKAKAAPQKADATKLTKTQQGAIKKIGRVLAKEDKAKSKSPKPQSTKTAKPSARAVPARTSKAKAPARANPPKAAKPAKSLRASAK